MLPLGLCCFVGSDTDIWVPQVQGGGGPSELGIETRYGLVGPGFETPVVGTHRYSENVKTGTGLYYFINIS